MISINKKKYAEIARKVRDLPIEKHGPSYEWEELVQKLCDSGDEKLRKVGIRELSELNKTYTTFSLKKEARMKVTTIVLAASILLTSCAELHQHQDRFVASGASANILFFQIPKDPLVAAQEKVPAGATVTNVNGTPNDWTTVLGFLNRLLGVGTVQIGGTTATK